MPLRRLLPDPIVDVDSREPPRSADLECGNLLRSREAVDRPFRDLQETRDLSDGEDLALSALGTHIPDSRGKTTTG